MENNILVLSFNSFSKESSNEKTIWSLIEPLSKNFKISQIFIKKGNPNIGNNCRFLLIDESNIVKPFISKDKICKELYKNDKTEVKQNSVEVSKKTKKSPLTMLVRNFLWRFMYRKFKNVFKWIDLEKPSYLFILDSDLAFFDYFALKIRKKYNCKIIFYTSENYCLKTRNYMNGKFGKDLFFKIFRKKLFKSHKKLLKNVDKEIFLTESLKDEYSKNFKISSPSIIMPSSNCKTLPIKKTDQYLTFSYCGNLKVGRFESLISFLEVVNKIENIKVIIAANLNKNETEIIKKYKCVEYLGFISFEEVINTYKRSDILLHVESFDKLISEDCKHAFTGKICDCIASLKPFLFFGPCNVYISKFLRENHCGFQVNDVNYLKNLIELLKNKRKILNSLRKYEEITAKRYFSKESNEAKIKETINV